MTDPFRVFKADPGRQHTLSVIWPELFNCLADVDNAAGDRVVMCALDPCAFARPRVPAEGRVFEHGHPACAEHLKLADRPGGWPLKIERKQARR